NFSVRWQGKLKPIHDSGVQTYTFIIKADDGARLWVDNQLVIDLWDNSGQKEVTGTITLDANRYYDIKMEYRDGRYGALAYLSWEPEGGSRSLIPPSAFYKLDPAASSSYDGDKDGMADAWELNNGLDTSVNDSARVLNGK